MDKSMEYLIGGILCLIIAVVSYAMFHRFSASMVVAIVLFIYGVYRVIKK